MITQQAANYAKVLFSLGIKEEVILPTKNIFLENKTLIEVFDNPVIKQEEKEAVIKAVFEEEIRRFIKLVCENKCIGIINEIFEAYEGMELASKNIIKATLTYVTKPDDTELEQIKNMVCSKYNKTGVSLKLLEDTSLIGGFVLTVGDMEYDKSIKGTLAEMQKTLVGR
jgi:F-type H+-transporting ATPase subunit delta